MPSHYPPVRTRHLWPVLRVSIAARLRFTSAADSFKEPQVRYIKGKRLDSHPFTHTLSLSLFISPPFLSHAKYRIFPARSQLATGIDRAASQHCSTLPSPSFVKSVRFPRMFPFPLASHLWSLHLCALAAIERTFFCPSFCSNCNRILPHFNPAFVAQRDDVMLSGRDEPK
ncbi:hypothetical protein IE81DRAFT_226266 [Ceraceosorus guamensis]|uniref:Uncharacterized protein n=1 Tax=Ceraceosorus guamensis TaxID=1522189 RepID=A0A316W5C3_9BASI|nr:hypothetical protein IE81DRAFT_226266 [Ceraceosorus guamensis]PWN45029.1 hypothetical protein IE81DRAFT_226266 [Ceraceosorus guamensis]